MKLRAVCLLALSLVAFAGSASAAEFKIDPSHTSVIFGIRHVQFSYTYGRFNTVKSGAFTLDDDPAKASFSLVLDAGSVDTNDAKRDEHLKGPDFFNAAQFPAIMFKSDKVTVKKTDRGERYVVDGKMTMHGETKPIQLELRKVGEGESPFGDYRAGFITRTELKRSDFGMGAHVGMVGDEVLITISFEGIRQ